MSMELKTYVIFSSDKAADDLAVEAMIGNGIEKYASGGSYGAKFYGLKIAEKGNNRLTVLSTCSTGEGWMMQLTDNDHTHFLGCIDNDCDNCCRENPSEHFSDDDRAKVDLANAWGLF